MVQICSIGYIYKRSRSPMHIFWSSGLFLNYPYNFLNLADTFRIIRSLPDFPDTFLHYPDSFLEYPDTFFRLSGHFLHHMENFQFIPTLHIIWIFCIVSGHFPKYLEILQQIMSLLQKLSGFAKTFRSALLTRWRGFSDSGYPCDSNPSVTIVGKYCPIDTLQWG